MIEMMALPIAIVMTLSMWILLSAVFYKPEKYEYPTIKEGRLLKERTKSYYNFFALIFNIRDGSLSKDVKEFELELAKLKSKDPLDKEIEELEKNIKIERDRKEKIQRIAALEREYDEIYREDEEASERANTDDFECPDCGCTKFSSDTLIKQAAGWESIVGIAICSDCGKTFENMKEINK